MLKIFKDFAKLDFGKLMTVYSQNNQENAKECYPNEHAGLAALCAEQDFLSYLKDIFFRTEGAFYAVWEQDGAYVSALRLEPYKNGLLLEALETAPQYRNSGYASSLMCAVLQFLADTDTACVYSHVNKRNTISLRTHTSCGFSHILEHAVYIDGSVNQDSCTLCYYL